MLTRHFQPCGTVRLERVSSSVSGNHQRIRFPRACTSVLVIVLTLLLLALLPPSAWAQSYMFNRADYSTGPGAGALALGDLNDDGRMDVIVVNAQGSDSV